MGSVVELILPPQIKNVTEEESHFSVVSNDNAIMKDLNEVARRIKLANNSHKRVGLGLHRNLRLKMGVDTDTMDENMFPEIDSFPYTTNLKMGYNFLFINSDIVDHTFVRDVEAPLLWVIPYHPAVTESLQQLKEFLNLHYVPVKSQSI